MIVICEKKSKSFFLDRTKVLGEDEGMKKLMVCAGLFALFFSFGCAAFKAKVPVYNNAVLNEIHYSNEEFAAELVKIPGLNTSGSPYTAGLAELWADYRGGAYKGAFEKILATGIVEGRAYCSPLEALLWLYAKDPKSARDILGSYDLTRLLQTSWGDCTGARWDDWGQIRARLSAPELCAYYTQKALKYIPEPNDGKNYLQAPYETILVKGGRL